MPARFVYPAVLHSCKYRWLHAPATITTCSERSPVFWRPLRMGGPQHRRQIPFQLDLMLALVRRALTTR